MVIDQFTMNGDRWIIRMVSKRDPILIDRTGVQTVATTDPETYTVNLSDILYGDMLMTVLIHELGHCALWSFRLLDDIHRMTLPRYWIDMEELICNILADYGGMIFRTAYRAMGYDAWKLIPSALEKYVA